MTHLCLRAALLCLMARVGGWRNFYGRKPGVQFALNSCRDREGRRESLADRLCARPLPEQRSILTLPPLTDKQAAVAGRSSCDGGLTPSIPRYQGAIRSGEAESDFCDACDRPTLRLLEPQNKRTPASNIEPSSSLAQERLQSGDKDIQNQLLVYTDALELPQFLRIA